MWSCHPASEWPGPGSTATSRAPTLCPTLRPLRLVTLRPFAVLFTFPFSHQISKFNPPTIPTTTLDHHRDS